MVYTILEIKLVFIEMTQFKLQLGEIFKTFGIKYKDTTGLMFHNAWNPQPYDKNKKSFVFFLLFVRKNVVSLAHGCNFSMCLSWVG